MNAWEDEEERGDGRSEPLLVENADRSKRKSTDQPPLTHLSLDFRYTKRARYQHLSNLVTCMRHFEATKEDEKLALVLATMLQAEVRLVCHSLVETFASRVNLKSFLEYIPLCRIQIL